MNRSISQMLLVSLAAGTLCLAGCEKQKKDPTAEGPQADTIVEHRDDVGLLKVENPDRFKLINAVSHQGSSALNVTGSVNPDISREIPVISLANGRVVDIHARLGDYVKKGQLLMEVQSTDVSGAFSQYLKASNDERLSQVQLERAKVLYDKGAIAKSQLEAAENSENDAKADLNAAEQQLQVLGVDKNHPSAAVKVYSPASGVIIAQNVTSAGAAGVSLAGSSTAFTVADLSHVWIVCDVYENDLSKIHIGQTADIRLNAFPDRKITGMVSDIGAVLDPNLRTAKVRIQIDNPQNMMRLGMFATASFQNNSKTTDAAVPASAILHLHDRDWVYVPSGQGVFRRLPVQAGEMLAGGMQEVLSGLQAGQQVVVNALEFQNSGDQ